MGVRPRSSASVARASAAWGGGSGVEPGRVAAGDDDLLADAADADAGGVGRVGDRRVADPGFSAGQGGADGRGLPGADFAGEHGDRAGGDGPGEPGDGLGVAVVAVLLQLAGGDVPGQNGILVNP